jgi:uncharacterized protein (TIGR04255 family)
MQNISFRKAPVVELVAELRWAPSGDGALPAGDLTLALGNQAEEFFQRFGNTVAKVGFPQAEKLIPAGIPPPWHHIAWRFRNPNDVSKLLQVGAGIFSANALQPYRRWREFEPTIELGVKALLESRSPKETDQPFTSASLRYINAFSGDLLGGKQPEAFIDDVLGFRQALPESISNLIGDNKSSWSTTINLLGPVTGKTKTVKVVVGGGKVKTDPAAIFDITVTDQEPVATGDVMTAFRASRNIIHQCFLDLTKPLHEDMEPESAD